MTFNSISNLNNFTIQGRPGLDPLTHQIRDYFSEKEYFIINGTMRDLGLIVKKLDRVNLNVGSAEQFEICVS